jgi:hypothetical protein
MNSSGYRQVSERAANWVSANLAQFEYHPDHDRTLTARLKALSELAIAAEVLLQNRREDVWFEKKSKEWLSFCWSQLNEGNILWQVIDRRADFLLFAAMYLPFMRNGMRNEQLEQAIRDGLRNRGASSHEFQGWVLLLIVRTLHLLEIESPWTIDSCFRDTWLHNLPEPWSIRNESAYSLTHTVFFLTDFGQRPDHLPEVYRQYLVLWLPVWLEHYRTSWNHDLLAEMIIVARCIHVEDENDWGSILLSRQEKDGTLRKPRMQQTGPNEVKDVRKQFQEKYHSTLAVLMASVMSLDDSARVALAKTVADPVS